MEWWKDGRMEGWNGGRMEGWKDGVLALFQPSVTKPEGGIWNFCKWT